ncbi:LysR family transcriptional regulator ArgP [Nitratidesulfovibrio liaohensis]|uniref:LysR family transcriptional regulator ArgP n=1 Tax=Nitratidesulfovibrio liaohensis TaxID=2604158 RepID=UPI0014217BD4|nr:LysR family transcriptional regulator ArgP [Nitratidesulfovibrio liaohensis]NHZ46816.1 LysR family transcriptional regulator ArgP [Nitratidesulfovibrio liaohensis]
MLDYRLVEAVAAVIREGGFERAARVLHLTQSAVSQRVKALEDQLGTVLVVRATPARATDEGRRLLAHCDKVGLLETDLAAALRPEGGSDSPGADAPGIPHVPWTTLPVAVNADSLATWFPDAVAPFLLAERALLDLSVDDQERTHLLLRDGNVAAAVSTRAVAVQGCRCLPLGRVDYLCLAAPHFAAQWFPAGLTEAALCHAPAVIFNRADEVHHQFLRGLLPSAASFDHIARSLPLHYIPSSERFVDVVAQGLAYGMIPLPQARQHLADGRLVDLAPGHSVPIRLYWHCWGLRTRLLDALTQHVVSHAQQVLAQE